MWRVFEGDEHLRNCVLTIENSNFEFKAPRFSVAEFSFLSVLLAVVGHWCLTLAVVIERSCNLAELNRRHLVGLSGIPMCIPKCILLCISVCS